MKFTKEQLVLIRFYAEHYKDTPDMERINQISTGLSRRELDKAVMRLIDDGMLNLSGLSYITHGGITAVSALLGIDRYAKSPDKLKIARQYLTRRRGDLMTNDDKKAVEAAFTLKAYCAATDCRDCRAFFSFKVDRCIFKAAPAPQDWEIMEVVESKDRKPMMLADLVTLGGDGK